MIEDTDIKLIGELNWRELKHFMITKLNQIDNEYSLALFLTYLATSIGDIEHVKKTRKRLGLKPLTKEELEEMK